MPTRPIMGVIGHDAADPSHHGSEIETALGGFVPPAEPSPASPDGMFLDVRAQFVEITFGADDAAVSKVLAAC